MFFRIFSLAKPYWRTLAVIAVVILVISGLRQVEPIIAQHLTDQLIGNVSGASFSSLARLLLILLAARLGISALNRLSYYLTQIYTIKLQSRLREIGFEHLLGLSVAFFHDNVSGKMMSQLDRGVNRITNVVNNSGMYFVPNLITAIFAVFMVSRYSWLIGLAAIGSFIPYAFINYWRYLKNAKLEKTEYRLYDNQYSHFWETISSMELIKSFIAENFELKRLRDFNRKLINLRRRMETNTNKALIGDIILEAWMWALYAYIVLLTFQHVYTVGTMVLLIGYVQLIREPLWSLNWMYWEAKRAQIGAREYFQILDVKPQIKDIAHPVALEYAKGRLTFDHVSFTYHRGRQVLDDISFTVKPGETVAFVGPSGVGKSTLAALILRFFEPTQGHIYLDGIDIHKIARRDLRKNIGIVMQDAYLFADTVIENLRYGNPRASQKEMELATRIANAHEFLAALPKGYKTEIGERGVKLSGGQKQRLSLARTILKNPPIIILDEATSSLDSHSELLIQASIEKVLKGRTALVIAHRLSTIARADKIIVLKDRHIIEQGNHQQLLAKNGLYASLFKVQSGQQDTLKSWGLSQS